MNTLQKFEAKQLEKLTAGKNIPDFSSGDTIKVNVKIREGKRERVQAYEGVCISKSKGGINASFTVRKISYGEGVERVFPLHSPRIDSIDIIRRGSVRRSKLYYLRGLRGKSARIVERTSGHGIDPQENRKKTKTSGQPPKKDASKKTEKKSDAKK